VKAEGQATDSEFDREKAEERVAKLGGAIGRIKVGAATETELKDKKLRYEDALNSVKAAMDEGIVPGGGSTLVYMLRYKQQILDAMESDDEKLAVDILFRAIQYPINQIAFNAGEEGALVLEKVKDKEFGYGWNAANGEYGDLFEMGVIDPATVTQQAIINSCSIAASVLTTNCLITEIREEEPPMMAGGADPMGGMPGM
jgi:chaperonin GroEL